MQFSNRLIGESSPYLLQHAHNPVDWYPWGEEAFRKASEEDKPILVSIGYAACHWCHVMERESFEDKDTADLMNALFVNIKVDREERPDIDHIYMDAVQAIAGSGGWPLHVFLTPNLKPFYGGTYYPPTRAYNRSSWKEVLQGIAKAFKEDRENVEQQAENLTNRLAQANSFGQSVVSIDPAAISFFSENNVSTILSNLLKLGDLSEGGFGRAPKFPQTFSIRFLLHNYYHTGNEEALKLALLSLDKMALGGINDQLGGGFARYSTDAEWLAPHFEKMLYDNALLVIAYSEAYQLTKKELYREVVSNTLTFIERELKSPEDGFYAALDADSEGVEGKFYVWSKTELDDLLGEDAALFTSYYDVSETGNWEHTNILRRKLSDEEFSIQNGISIDDLRSMLERARQTLFSHRALRTRPALDDKILLGWNALMNTAYSRAYQALGDPSYKSMAVKNMRFLLQAFEDGEDKGLSHTYKNGVAKYPAFLDDYAYLIEALLELQEITGESDYLLRAVSLLEYVVEHFSEAETGFFYFTAYGQKDVVIRKKEIYDGAIPSGNSVMAINLYRLGVLMDIPAWRDRSLQMTANLQQAIIQYPGSFGVWATFFQSLTFGVPEIALVGEEIDMKHEQILRNFTSLRIYQSTTRETKSFPLLANKPLTRDGLIFLCKNYSCQTPVNEVDVFLKLLNGGTQILNFQ